MTTDTAIRISPADPRWIRLNALLQQGVWCRAQTPVPLMAFLTDQLGIDPAYIHGRVETVFLDTMVVDDLERSVVLDGSTVTLSAAMPGLVGATLRRGGYYAAMRTEISWSQREGAAPATETRTGLVRVKLFNLILREIGPALLRRGVLVDREAAIATLGEVASDAVEDAATGKILIELGDS